MTQTKQNQKLIGAEANLREFSSPKISEITIA